MGTFDNLKKNLSRQVEERRKTELSQSNQRRLDSKQEAIVKKAQTRNYEDWGFEKAKKMNGSQSGLVSCFALIKEESRQIFEIDKTKVQKWENDLESEIKSHEAKEEEKTQNADDIQKKRIPEKEGRITHLDKEIYQIKKKPDSVMPDKASKVGFYIGLAILIGLSAYLFIFYSSATYSAVYKKFDANDLKITNTIFDANALSKAYEENLGALAFILFLPFIFMGLGFLIHQFQKAEGKLKYLKIMALIAVTFAFDMILAYEITEKIYDLKAQNSFEDLPKFEFADAWSDVNFWLIIFAGFIAYLIWGFVFDFTMEAHEKIDAVRHEIAVRKKEQSRLKKEIDKDRSMVEKLSRKARDIKKTIGELKAQLHKGIYIGSVEFTEGLNKNILDFWGGWLHWMNANKVQGVEIERCKKLTDDFIGSTQPYMLSKAKPE